MDTYLVNTWASRISAASSTSTIPALTPPRRDLHIAAFVVVQPITFACDKIWASVICCRPFSSSRARLIALSESVNSDLWCSFMACCHSNFFWRLSAGVRFHRLPRVFPLSVVGGCLFLSQHFQRQSSVIVLPFLSTAWNPSTSLRISAGTDSLQSWG